MDLSNGTPVVAIPGPTILPDRIRQAFARPMPDIYAGELVEVSTEVVRRLPGLARTDGQAFIVVSNGHGAWQMAVSNVLMPGDSVLVLESGRFAVAWGRYAELAGVKVETLAGDFRSAVDPDRLTERLRADTSGEIKAVLVAHTDTASSVRNDLSALRAAIDSADHGCLLMVDCIASIACERFEMDECRVDVAVGASQKGLMCPPGVAFVWAGRRALDRAKAVRRSVRGRVGYLDWESRIEPERFYETFAGTPPVAHMFALKEAMDMIDEEGGLESVWARHRALADAVRSAVAAWSTPDGLGFNIVDPAHRANSVTTIRTGVVDAERVRELCQRGAGLTLGIGIAAVPGSSFRIGHMGYVNPPTVLGTIATIEAALIAIGAPMDASGAAAAAESIGSALGSNG